jgi:hypothetical protein
MVLLLLLMMPVLVMKVTVLVGAIHRLLEVRQVWWL